jgi:hypothetical protein
MAEGELLGNFVNRLLLGCVLGTGFVVGRPRREPRLSSNLRGGASLLAAEVGGNWVIEEEGVFIEVVLRLVDAVPGFGAHGPLRGRVVLDFVLELIGRTGRVLSAVLNLGQLADVEFFGFSPLGFREVVGRSGALGGKG